MEEDGLQQQISSLVKRVIQEQLLMTRPSLAYDGTPKPVNKNFPSPEPSPWVNTGSLVNQVDVYFESDLEDGEANLVVDFGSANYWEFVFFGRRPSVKFPNLAAITSWVASKPALNVPNLSLEQRAFLVGRSIQRYGYKGILPNGDFNYIFELVEPRIAPLLGQLGVDYVLNLLEKERIIFRTDTNRPV